MHLVRAIRYRSITSSNINSLRDLCVLRFSAVLKGGCTQNHRDTEHARQRREEQRNKRMRARPIRPNIYLPVVRFGVADSDWLTVLLISCAAYLVTVPFGVTVLYVPLQMWTWLLMTAGTIAFFNYIRIGRRAFWLQHKLSALVRHHRQNRLIPGFRPHRNRFWPIDSGESTGDRRGRMSGQNRISIFESVAE